MVGRNGILVLAVLTALLSFWFSPMQWSWVSLAMVTEEASSLGLVALGLLLLFHAGTFDFSAGAVFALSLVSLAFLWARIPWPLACLVAWGVAVLACVVNGLLSAWLRSAFVVTFALGVVWRRLALIIGGDVPLSPVDTLDNPIALLSFSPALGLPVSFLVLVALTWWLHRAFRTSLHARNVLAIGLDSERSRTLGVPVETYRVACFAIAGLLIGLAATMYFSRIASASPNSGDSLTFEALAIVVAGNGGLHRHRPAPFKVLLVSLCVATVQVAAAGLDQGPNIAPLLTGMLLLLALLQGRSPRGKRSPLDGQ